MYIKRKTRVSMVPEKNVSSRRSRACFRSGPKLWRKKGLRLMNSDEYLDRRETILHLYAILHLQSAAAVTYRS